MNHDAQAAMEFLLTYGWAIIAVLTAIFALSYYGVLDVSKYFAHETCTMEIGLSCLDSSVVYYVDPGFGTISNNLNLVVKNNLGERQKVIDFTIAIYDKYGIDYGYNEINPLADLPNNVDPQTITITDMTNTASGNPPLQKGDKYDLEFTLTLLNTETKLEHTYHVSMTGRVI